MLDRAQIIKETEAAKKRIETYIRETPLEYSHYLSQFGSCNVYLKLENIQKTGSFKLRGAANLLLSLSKEERKNGILSTSSGNHANALAYLCDKMNIKGTCFLPQNASRAKISALDAFSLFEIKYHGTDVAETENYVREMSRTCDSAFVPPYNDPRIIAGQATIALELKEQLVDDLHAVFVPVGGGGLISGIAGYLKSIDKNTEVIGCQPENSAVMYHSIQAGKILEMKSKPTYADGTAGGIEKDSITFDYCKRFVDDFVLVSENDIKQAIRLMIEKHYMLIEGAAALSIASFIKIREKYKGKNVVLTVSGNKISLDKLKAILNTINPAIE